MNIIYGSNGYLSIEVESDRLETTLRYEHFNEFTTNKRIEELFTYISSVKNQDYDLQTIERYLEEKRILKK